MRNKDTITSLDIITLTISGMRVREEYEILRKEDKAELSFYIFCYNDGEEKRRLEKRAEIGLDTVISLLNDCRVYKWDGFHGKNPPHVLDGTMFTFKAIVNGGREIFADGSNNFPKHYRELTGKLTDYLREGGETL